MAQTLRRQGRFDAVGRRPLRPGRGVEVAHAYTRSIIPHYEQDLLFKDDIARCLTIMRSQAFEDLRPDWKAYRRKAFAKQRVYNLTEYVASIQAETTALEM